MAGVKDWAVAPLEAGNLESVDAAIYIARHELEFEEGLDDQGRLSGIGVLEDAGRKAKERSKDENTWFLAQGRYDDGKEQIVATGVNKPTGLESTEMSVEIGNVDFRGVKRNGSSLFEDLNRTRIAYSEGNPVFWGKNPKARYKWDNDPLGLSDESRCEIPEEMLDDKLRDVGDSFSRLFLTQEYRGGGGGGIAMALPGKTSQRNGLGDEIYIPDVMDGFFTEKYELFHEEEPDTDNWSGGGLAYERKRGQIHVKPGETPHEEVGEEIRSMLQDPAKAVNEVVFDCEAGGGQLIARDLLSEDEYFTLGVNPGVMRPMIEGGSGHEYVVGNGSYDMDLTSKDRDFLDEVGTPYVVDQNQDGPSVSATVGNRYMGV